LGSQTNDDIKHRYSIDTFDQLLERVAELEKERRQPVELLRENEQIKRENREMKERLERMERQMINERRLSKKDL
jgi:uncharacterized protein HemY